MFDLKALRFISALIFVFLPYKFSFAEPAPELDLTEKERQWLEIHKTVTFTGDPNWLPYEAFDEKGEYIGIVSEHLKLIAEMTGISFDMSPSKTWTESTEKAKQGLVDILSETDDSDLKSHLVFTNNYVSNPIVIAMHNRENYVEGISKISKRKIALIKDYGYASKIRRKYSNIQFETVDDIQHGLISVSTGQVDALLCTLALCSYTIAELGLNNVRIVGKTEFDTKLALGVQKHLPELVSILNKAISKITPGQQQVILDAWIKQKFAAKTDYTLVYQVIAVAIVLLAIFAFWNRRLSQEINLRIATERELKASEEEQRVSRERLLLHREQTPLADIEWNTDFEVVYWNKAAERIFGFTNNEVIGRRITEQILPESARKAVDKVWQSLMDNKGGERSTNENITKDGSTILCEWYNKPLIDQDGKVIGVTSLVDDVTEQKQAEQELQKMQNLKSIGVLAGGIAHDFNNILMGLFGNISLAKEKLTKNDPAFINLENAEQSMGRATRLTNQLLTFAKGGVPIKENVSIEQLAEEVTRFDLSGSNVELIFEPPNDLWEAEVDKGQMQQVFSNLAINAKQAMPDGGHLYIKLENITIGEKEILQVRPGNYIKITVQDEGTGIDKEHINRIFDPYFSTKQTGSGLGLSTCYSIVSNHDGYIAVDSVIGEGSTFTLYLPASLNQTLTKSEQDVTQVSPLTNESKILVMDDDLVILKLVTEMLENVFTIETATDGAKAVKLYRESIDADKPFDAVIMDLTIPGGMGGEEAVKEVLSIDPLANVIVSSGYAHGPVMANYMDYGFKGIATKPYTKVELFNVINQVMEKN